MSAACEFATRRNCCRMARCPRSQLQWHWDSRIRRTFVGRSGMSWGSPRRISDDSQTRGEVWFIQELSVHDGEDRCANHKERSMFRRASIAFIVLFVVTSARAAEPDFAALDKRWSSAAEELGIPGMAVVVVKDDLAVFQKCWGHGDAARSRPVTVDSGFYIASCTKTFNATAIMVLAEEGKVNLDDPVTKYLPNLKLSDENLTKTLTIRDLLSHARGVDSDPVTFGE